MRPRAAVKELFASIQGEGRFVGVPMVFLRLATCPIRCRYCDTPESWSAEATFAVRSGAAERPEPNPVDAERAARLVTEVARSAPLGPRAGALRVSVTGGEPLVFPAFVRALGEALPSGTRLHLETAALDADALRVALPALAHVSADYKLPETLLGGDHRPAHVACLAVLDDAPEVTCDVKIVLTDAVGAASFGRALDDLAPFAARIVLILQPATAVGDGARPAGPALLEHCIATAVERGFDVRVIPQVHPVLGLR